MAPTPNDKFPLYTEFHNWLPFRLDALGLITLLGADEVCRVCGSLTRNTLTDYLPLFGAYKVASNQIADIEPGFALYNISDGVWVTELNPWLTRWLYTNLQSDYALLKWSVRATPRRKLGPWLGMLLGALINFGLIAFAVVQADWYGLANAVAMSLSVIVRAYIETAYRRVIDNRLSNYHKKSPNGPTAEQMAKFMIVLPDGRLTIYRTDRALIPIMLDTRIPVQPIKMWIVRGFGWLAFGVQIIAVGQSFLPTQLATVVIMTLASVMTIFRIGAWRVDQVGNYLKIEQRQLRPLNSSKVNRMHTYAWLNPSEEQEEYMLKRALLPDKMWKKWWADWDDLKAQRDDAWKTNGTFDIELKWLGFTNTIDPYVQQPVKS